jgi:hypothetical protein
VITVGSEGPELNNFEKLQIRAATKRARRGLLDSLVAYWREAENSGLDPGSSQSEMTEYERRVYTKNLAKQPQWLQAFGDYGRQSFAVRAEVLAAHFRDTEEYKTYLEQQVIPEVLACIGGLGGLWPKIMADSSDLANLRVNDPVPPDFIQAVFVNPTKVVGPLLADSIDEWETRHLAMLAASAQPDITESGSLEANAHGDSTERPSALANEDPEDEQGIYSWAEIEISFLSDERVSISKGDHHKTFNYAEFGFEDRRSGKPNSAWVMLRGLSQQGGIIAVAENGPHGWARVEKRAQEIRKRLRQHFGIPTDPLPYIRATGYKTAFRISCRPSFDC